MTLGRNNEDLRWPRPLLRLLKKKPPVCQSQQTSGGGELCNNLNKIYNQSNCCAVVAEIEMSSLSHDSFLTVSLLNNWIIFVCARSFSQFALQWAMSWVAGHTAAAKL